MAARSMLLLWGAVLMLALGACGLVIAPGAHAAGAVNGSSLQDELNEAPAEESTTATSTTSNTSSTSTTNNQKTVLLAIVAAVILLSGIGFVIARDARRVAPATDAELAEARSGGRDPAVMMRKRRAKAKAARRQRKRNR